MLHNLIGFPQRFISSLWHQLFGAGCMSTPFCLHLQSQVKEPLPENWWSCNRGKRMTAKLHKAIASFYPYFICQSKSNSHTWYYREGDTILPQEGPSRKCQQRFWPNETYHTTIRDEHKSHHVFSVLLLLDHSTSASPVLTLGAR